MDVYHKFANSGPNFDFAHNYVHGLNDGFLKENGFPSQMHLIADFKQWLATKPYRVIYANDPTAEKNVFSPLYIENIGLPGWKTRVNQAYHIVANQFKKLNVPILNTSCHSDAHTDFMYFHPNIRSEAQIAKALHGHHCSLYDVYELYLFYVMRNAE